jgi:hypothetical protein
MRFTRRIPRRLFFPPEIHPGIQNSQWFGRGLACAAGNVVVGSPGWRAGGNASFEGVGMVQMFELGSRVAAPSATVDGDAPQQQFGFSVAISGSLLLIGSPGHSPNASTFAGKVDAFNMPLSSRHAAWSAAGDQPFARFGMTMTAAPGVPVVAVGQPHRKCACRLLCGGCADALQDRCGRRQSRRCRHAARDQT